MIALDPKTLGETLGDVRTVAQATDRREQGVELVRDAATRIDRVKLAVRGQPRPRVAALEWLDPVYVAGHWTPQLIELAGGEDVLGLAGEPSEDVSWETARAPTRPEVVVVMPCGYDERRAHAEALACAAQLGGAGRTPGRRGQRLRVLLPAGPAPDRRPGAARARAAPERVSQAPAGAAALEVELRAARGA